MSRIFTRAEVALHNEKKDCWVIIFGRVFDVSPVLAVASSQALCDPVLGYAGSDISHWFQRDEATGIVDIRYAIHPTTLRKVPYLPEGPFVGTPVLEPSSAAPAPGLPWWQDDRYVVGRLTSRPRRLRVINTLTSDEHRIEVGDEATVDEIRHKFLLFNAHCASYTWKAFVTGEFRALDIRKTLSANGVPDDTAELERIGMDPDDPDNMTTLLICFNDDLTVA